MKKLIITIQIISIILLLISVPRAEQKYYLMNVTFYSRHPNCIANKWNDGMTATMTPIREGVVAINVDFIKGQWVVRSPLKLGQQIYIEGLGEFSVEDTGRFAERDEQQDIWTVDVYIENYKDALKSGRQLKKVFVIDN